VAEADAVRGLVSPTGQYASVDEDLTGWENLVLLARLLGHTRAQAKARASELLDAFGLTDAAGRLASSYSGGMRRRLDIAASIVVTPQLLFFMEILEAFDATGVAHSADMARNVAGAWGRGSLAMMSSRFTCCHVI
jgi:ABC-2 type transport system ATP-binding protein